MLTQIHIFSKICTIFEVVMKVFDENSEMVIYLDFCKAFDKVSHGRLTQTI